MGTGIGIIGYGSFARFLHNAWEELDDVRVTAASARTASKDPGGLNFYTDWKEMLQDESVDVVSIATPPFDHAEMAVACLEAGKHVLVEKPPALTAADAEEILAASERCGRLAAVNYVMRHNPLVQVLRTIVKSNLMGSLQHVDILNYAGDGHLVPEHWFWDKSRSGGILVEHAVHFFDLVQYVYEGQPAVVGGHGVERQPGMEDKVLATVEYEEGLICTHYHHFARPAMMERQVFRFGFDLGQVVTRGWVPSDVEVDIYTDKQGESRVLALLPVEDYHVDALQDSQLRSGGIDYEADRRIRFRYSLPDPIGRVYERCAQDVLSEMLEAVEGGDGLPRTALANVMDSIRIAEAARKASETGQAVALQSNDS